MANILSNPTRRVLERGLDVASARHQILANNVANVDTPGFKRSGVDFAQAMADAMKAADSHGQSVPSLRVVTEEATVLRNDGNNVDIEREMAEIAENNLLFNALTQLLSQRYAQLRTVINEGRR
ncbi:MAG: flagellar basal body rod protein FlgB [Bacillota bacterium]